jgi:zinc protease
MKKQSVLLMGFMWMFNILNAQEIPFDPSIKTGTLSNGVRYFIQKNAKPEKQAALRLVVNVGSIEEDEDQLGLAHLLEHMAFNGTKKYPKNKLVSYLQKIGMRFGPDLNAYTSFDETVYMLQVPADQEDLVKNGIEILSEWAHNVTLEDEEINKERGVVIEEWRGGKGAQERIQNKQLPIIFDNSRYASRLPIGTEESLKNFNPDAVRRFYKTWYRPDLQAVIVVGDVDVEKVESFIKQFFAPIPAASTLKPRGAYSIPDYAKNQFQVSTDPELPYSMVQLLQAYTPKNPALVSTFQNTLLRSIYDSILQERLTEYTKKPNPPFVAGFSTGQNIARTKTIGILAAAVTQGTVENAFKTLLTERYRVYKHGFLASELDRAKAKLLNQYESAVREVGKTDSRALMAKLVAHYLSNAAVPTAQWELEQVKSFFENLDVAAINAYAKSKNPQDGQAFMVSMPQKDGLTPPTEDDLKAFLAQIEASDIAPYTEEVSTEPLFSATLNPGTTRTKASANGVTRLTLSNGVQVVVKPTTLKNDQILIRAIGEGGNATLSDVRYLAASSAATIVGQSGVGNFNESALSKKLAGKKVNVAPFIGSTTEGFNGSSSPEDIETALQLIHLFVTQPRFDADVLSAYKSNFAGFFEGMKNNPEAVFNDSVSVALYNAHFRELPPSPERINAMNLEKSAQYYKERFGDVSDFTFYFVGNVDVNKLQTLAERYLATLPAEGRIEEKLDEGIRLSRGQIHKNFKGGKEEKALSQITYTGDFNWSVANEIKFDLLMELLDIRVTETLREDMGGVYSPSVVGYVSKSPWKNEYQITTSYSSAPNRVAELASAVENITQNIVQNGATAAELEKIKTTLIRAHESNVQNNFYWLNALADSDTYGVPVAQLTASPQQIVNRVTSAEIKQLAKRYFNANNLAKFVLMPE